MRIQYLSIFIAALFISGCKHSVEKNELSATNQDTVFVSKESSVKSVEIPRTHLGITLGMPYSEAKEILLNNVCKRLDEDFDEIHKSIIIERGGDWLGNWEEKYSLFYIEIFDNKVYSISLEPQKNPAEVIYALKNKYPFDVEQREELRYHSNGLVTKGVRRSYSCANDKTEIYLDDNSYMIRYRDVKLKMAKQEYWEAVEKKEKEDKETDVEQQIVNY